VQVKMSTRLHADMDAHESTVELHKSIDGAVTQARSVMVIRGHARFEFQFLCLFLASLLTLKFSVIFKSLSDALLINYPSSLQKHLHCHPFSFRPPPIAVQV
jgi:hypothetical protein